MAKTEQQRVKKPQIFDFTPDSDILVSATALRKELRCPICLDLFRKCVATKSCLHRFCSDCIVEALRKSNHECPICRTKLATKRETHEQTHIDRLIRRLFPQHANPARSPTTSRSGNEGESETDAPVVQRSNVRGNSSRPHHDNEPFDGSPAEDSLDSATNQNENVAGSSNSKRKRGANDDEPDGVSTSHKRSRVNANDAGSGKPSSSAAAAKSAAEAALLTSIDANVEVQVILNPLLRDTDPAALQTELQTRNLRTNAYATVMHVDFYLQRFRAPLEDAAARDVGTKIAKSKNAARFHFFVKVRDSLQPAVQTPQAVGESDASTNTSANTNGQPCRLERIESSLTLRGLLARYATRWNSLQCSCVTEGQQVYAGLKPIELKLGNESTQLLPHVDLWYRERERDNSGAAS